MSADQNAPTRFKDATPRPVSFAFVTPPTSAGSLEISTRSGDRSPLTVSSGQLTALNVQLPPSPGHHRRDATPLLSSHGSQQPESTLPFHQGSRHSEAVIRSASPAPIAASVQPRVIQPVVTTPVPVSASSSAVSAPSSAPVSLTRTKKRTVKARRFKFSVGVLKWGSSSITAALFLAMFAVYGWTVSLEEKGSTLYRELTELREADKGMRNMTEGLAKDAAQRADAHYLPGLGSILPLTAAPPRPPVVDAEEGRPAQSQPIRPVRGY
ncbi:MAG: hypothetical protein VKL39_12300 [Leptolyngbyaceae bacterium]|nr:hypothetical protein [Leptolyngbyaceae bacterium]